MAEKTYTLREFMEAETIASVSVKWAEAGRSDEQTTKDIDTLIAKMDEDDELVRLYPDTKTVRRTFAEWQAYLAEGIE